MCSAARRAVAGRNQRAYRFVVPDLQEVMYASRCRIWPSFVFSVGFRGRRRTRQPTTTVPDNFGVSCMEKLQPEGGRHGKGSTVSECKTTVLEGCPLDMRVRQRGAAPQSRWTRTEQTERLCDRACGSAERSPARQCRPAAGLGQRNRARDGWQRTGFCPRFAPGRDGNLVKTMTVPSDRRWRFRTPPATCCCPGLPPRAWCELESITYDDGTVWKLRERCLPRRLPIFNAGRRLKLGHSRSSPERVRRPDCALRNLALCYRLNSRPPAGRPPASKEVVRGAPMPEERALATECLSSRK